MPNQYESIKPGLCLTWAITEGSFWPLSLLMVWHCDLTALLTHTASLSLPSMSVPGACFNNHSVHQSPSGAVQLQHLSQLWNVQAAGCSLQREQKLVSLKECLQAASEIEGYWQLKTNLGAQPNAVWTSLSQRYSLCTQGTDWLGQTGKPSLAFVFLVA